MKGFTRHPLNPTHHLWLGYLPANLVPSPEQTQQLWDLHPENYHEIMMHGRLVKTPRWQQAYGADYRYTGQVNRALPLHPLMEQYLQWMQAHIDPRLNGLLFNWYEGSQKHYIGKHRDSTHGMCPGSPIVTLSMGETRTFRMRPWKQKGYQDIEVSHGSLLVIPWETNQAWTHEVPHFARHTGRRVSITARAFEG